MPDWVKITLVLLLAAALRIPGVFWGEIDRPSFIVLEPDEFQHVDLAADYLRQWDPEMGYPLSYRFWNSRAYGYQLAWLAYAGEKLGWVKAKTAKLTLLGRFLSVAYALGLIFLLYRFALFLFGRSDVALLAALFLAIFDLDITYSHYALPEVAYNFWAHAAVFSIAVLFYRLDRYIVPPGSKQLLQEWRWWLLVSFCTALAFAVKFDFLPLVVAALGIFLLLVRRKLSFATALLAGLFLLLLSTFFFFAAHGFNMTPEDVKYSFDIAAGLNKDSIPKDQHLLHNPLLYLLGAMAGASLPVLVFAVYGSFKTFFAPSWRKEVSETMRICLLLFLSFLAMEFLVRWLTDTTFVRRVLFLMPYLALLGSWGLLHFLHNIAFRFRPVVLGLVVIYTLAIAVTSQYNFWRDTRYQALDYVQRAGAGKAISYSGYAWIPGMPGEVNQWLPDPAMIVAHETYYGRYWKYFTTPFKVPECCAEVYNCRSKEDCAFYQDLLSGNTEYILTRLYPTLEIMPERLLFKHLFGTYETFLGDVRIYEKSMKN